MSLHKQLTHQQQYQIYAILKAGFFQTAMARENGAHKSTVGRELKRNRRCRPKQAHVTALQRCRQAREFVHVAPALMALVVILNKQNFSPKQVAYLTDIIRPASAMRPSINSL